MTELTRITHDPLVMGGSPCIRGMRVTVSAILGLMADGLSHAEILKDYPYLEKEDLLAALEHQEQHSMLSSRPPPEDLLYAAEDYTGAEYNWHFKQVHLLVDTLQRHLDARGDAFVGGNIFLLHYTNGGRYERLVPDVLVALGVAPATEHERDHGFLVWKEGVPPAVIIEIAAGATQQRDVLDEAEPYAFVGVAEYYLLDPEAKLPTARLQGCHRTAGGQYIPLEGPVLESRVLGLELLVVDDWLRLRDPDTGRLLPTSLELTEELAAAEAEISHLRAELARRPDAAS